MSVEVINCEQNSPEWYEARLGIPTASNFATVMAKGEGKTRRTYMLKLAGEILTGAPAENYSNAAMERGHEMEPEALKEYSFMTNSEPELIGFVRNGNKGASPDCLVGPNGLGEFKSKAPHILIEVLLKDQFPPEHRAQCQGALWVAEREWVDIVCFWPKLPLFVKRAYRDEAYIKTISDEVDRFNDELAATVEQIRRYGQLEAA